MKLLIADCRMYTSTFGRLVKSLSEAHEPPGMARARSLLDALENSEKQNAIVPEESSLVVKSQGETNTSSIGVRLSAFRMPVETVIEEDKEEKEPKESTEFIVKKIRQMI